jgi:hypothetical protein
LGGQYIPHQDRQKNEQNVASTNNLALTLNQTVFHRTCIFNMENDDEQDLTPPSNLHVPSYM